MAARALLTTTLLLAACGGGDPMPPEAAPQAERNPPAPTPEPADARLDEALLALARGDFDQARSLSMTVASQRPTSARAAFLVGLSFHKQKNYGAALPHFDRAIELGPTFQPFAPVHYFRGWCLFYLGRLEAARAAFEAHLARVPDEADSMFGLGLIAFEQGRMADAERELERARQGSAAALAAGDRSRAADVAKAHARLADVHLASDDLGGAREDLEACLGLYPAHYTAWYKLYQVLLRLGDDPSAALALRNHDLWKERVRPGSGGLSDG